MLFFKIQTESECDGVENERWAKKKKETVAVISRGQKHFKKSLIIMKLLSSMKASLCIKRGCVCVCVFVPFLSQISYIHSVLLNFAQFCASVTP